MARYIIHLMVESLENYFQFNKLNHQQHSSNKKHRREESTNDIDIFPLKFYPSFSFIVYTQKF